MAHSHAAEDRNVYYIEQLCTIGFCGALGVVQILLYHYQVLKIILASQFHIPVLISGIVLTALALIRGIALWVAAGRANENHGHSHDECSHDHDHAHSHDHEHEHRHHHEHGHHHEHEHGIVVAEHVHTHACDHEHHDHDHEQSHDHVHADCGHEHGWAPWRYVILLLPILLFLMGMPWPAEAREDEPLEAGVMPIEFMALQRAADTDGQRDYWEGKLVRVKGQYAPGHTDKTFKLYRMKMTCCAADAYELKLTIISEKETLPHEKLQGMWVNATGHIRFEKPKGQAEWVTNLVMRSAADVKQSFPDSTPYLQ